MPKLTKRTIDALKSEAAEFFVWDSQIAGFGVRVLPSGAKTYQAQYRKGGRTRRVSLGRHGKITVDEARRLAKDVMGQVAMGERATSRPRTPDLGAGSAPIMKLTPSIDPDLVALMVAEVLASSAI
ncbi:Arm DNA-binding domain-containing protein [Yoonia sediminilitoris]|uniref:Uncharacterized protein DUF4102 n=1 Tax=Yoonia sediminilitoris TaxID=1286148 RepID=A0A2T6K691_9RHOB|nr:Arm DNA-binding domain-containing protein [Yoonia sediminilitoris]PUB10179.1 uncharacterized protein DUF4102 [Yoonia sediminilitoris]RCW89701.1 uncharacterized protein DUF4102 [Yoonia sediminilitoris]